MANYFVSEAALLDPEPLSYGGDKVCLWLHEDAIERVRQRLDPHRVDKWLSAMQSNGSIEAYGRRNKPSSDPSYIELVQATRSRMERQKIMSKSWGPWGERESTFGHAYTPPDFDSLFRSLEQYRDLKANLGKPPVAIVCPTEWSFFSAAGIRSHAPGELAAVGDPVEEGAAVFREPRERENERVRKQVACATTVLLLAAPFIVLPFPQASSVYAVLSRSVLFVALAVVAYWLRSRARFSYGMVECFVGILLAYRAFDGSTAPDRLSAVLAACGSMYVIVRGLDNIGKSLRSESWLRKWQFWFGKDFR